MASLMAVASLDFSDLKAELGLTDGNLSTHLAALEKAGYVSVTKGFRGRKPLTTLAVTAKGRSAMENYIRLLQGILDKAK